jgi:peroxiredoxin
MTQLPRIPATIRTTFLLLIAGVISSHCALAASSAAEQLQSEPSQAKLKADQTPAPDQGKPLQKPGAPPGAAGHATSDAELDALFREYAKARESSMNTLREAIRTKKAPPPAKKSDDYISRIGSRVLEVASKEPRTTTAEKALVWLVTTEGVNFGPEAETALTILARDHAASDRFKDLVYPKSFLFWHSNAAEALLRRLIASNPSLEIRGRAAFHLAQLLEERSQYVCRWQLMGRSAPVYFGPAANTTADRNALMKSDPRKLEDEAAELYERVIAEFATVKVAFGDDRFPQTPLAGIAKIPLRALRRFSVGKVAPEIDGVDLDGKAMKLSDYRGKLVVLHIRGHLNHELIPPEQIPQRTVARFRQLNESVQEKPVSLLGVVGSDREAYKKALEEQHVPMRFFWDPETSQGYSKIRWAWSSPGNTINYVLDRDGVIRYKLIFVRAELEKALSVLLDEMAGRDRSGKPR